MASTRNELTENVIIEAHIRPSCIFSVDIIEDQVIKYLETSFPVFHDTIINFSSHMKDNDTSISGSISTYVQSIRICDIGYNKSISFWKAKLLIYCYRSCIHGPERDYMDENLQDGQELPATEQWELPNQYLEGLWESIIIDDGLKAQLLGYTTSSLLFSTMQLDPTIINWNRMILLYGPPGTGKTTLCKALAHKIAIRQRSSYSSAILLEINSHSLFSKWFSESGKLVMKLFDQVSELADDDQCLVMILIDEVESITVARQAGNSNEPGDAIRVVNAVLTSLDSLKRRKNVLVLSTSNLVDSIDPAFRDRLDMQIYLGPPNVTARYEILRSCLIELMRCHIIHPAVSIASTHAETSSSNAASGHIEGLLYETSSLADGYSGRKLRKIPLQAHAMKIRRPQAILEEFILAIQETIRSSTASIITDGI